MSTFSELHYYLEKINEQVMCVWEC